jgi:hypothetical protein
MTVIDADHDHADSGNHGDLRLGAPKLGASSPAVRLVRLVASPWRIALLAVAAVLAVDAGGTDDGAGVCVFRRCTGGYCPGCGMTRSARHLTRGEVGAAWHDHPIIVLLAVQGVVGAALFATVRTLRPRLRSLRTLAIVAAVNGVLLLAIWVVRLVDGSIPRFF